MSGKKNIRIPISNNEKLVTFELKNDIDLLEILSLKFTQSDIYQSGLCSDYGVVVGRITANNGLGIPNAKVSIFVPLDENDEIDPVISEIYPYKFIDDKNIDGYRYNLLPKRKQHGGHVPTGTFFDQEDILSAEEYLEVFEKYYTYTAKSNMSGDFMIWGVPVGNHTIHIDIDLSDIGCFSLRPYDFIIRGYGQENFDRFYNFKSSSDIDGLPQIVQFNKKIEVYPFMGNEELCEIGISRVDYDLSESDIKIEPVAVLLVSSFTDDDSKSIRKSGAIKPKMGYKCNLQTIEGVIESVRFTGGKVYGTDGTLYPELEYFNIPETIDENGVAMVVLPMNIDYMYTNEFGEQEITNDKNKGVPTKLISRFRLSLNSENNKVSTAKYLLPNIREFNSRTDGKNLGLNGYGGEIDQLMLSSYIFSDVFEDYIKIPNAYSGITFDYTITESIKNYKRDLILNYNNVTNELIPQDYFYKFTYGKVYTVSSFQGSHYETTQIEKFSLLNNKRKDSFLGIKEIKPSEEDDCSSSTNYIPVNYAYRNNFKVSLIIAKILLLIQFIFYRVSNWIYESLGSIFLFIGQILGNVGETALGDIQPLIKAGDFLTQLAFKIQEYGQAVLPLTTYPDCEECTSDVDNISSNNTNIDSYCRSGEIKTEVVKYNGGTNAGVYLVFKTGMTPSWLNTTGVSSIFLTENAKEDCATGITENQLLLLDDYLVSGTTSTRRFIGDVYSLDESFENFNTVFGLSQNDDLIVSVFDEYYVNLTGNTNYFEKISYDFDVNNNILTVTYDETAPEDINVKFTFTIIECNNSGNNGTYNEILTILSGNTEITKDLSNYLTDGCSISIIEIDSVYPNTKMMAIFYNNDEWLKYIGNFYPDNNSEVILRLYDRNATKQSVNNNTLIIEQGCQKYDKFYDEVNNQYTFIWSSGNTEYDAHGIDYPINSNTQVFVNNKKWDWNDSQYLINSIPQYTTSSYRESLTSPGINYTLLSTISGSYDTWRLPSIVRTKEYNKLNLTYHTYKKKTKSGLTEIRDGVFIIVPVIRGKSHNETVIKEWYRRKLIGLSFCSGVVNYSFIDNWLNGVLYFFKFDKRIVWDNEENNDLSQRLSKYPRELIYFNILDSNFYYRSTPFNPVTKKFIGQTSDGNYKELLHPTTFYDVGVRDEFYYEICSDPTLDPTCSVVRDITTTSYQDPSNIIEYGISYKLDTTKNSTPGLINNNDVNLFFQNSDFNKRIETINGDIMQLMSINSETGIEAFDLDSSQYFMYNNELLDPEDPNTISYFTGGTNSYGPLPIDFKLDVNGKNMRLCLNNSLGDYSQVVPFYLWDKKGEGFGSYDSKRDNQLWDRNEIASLPLQKIYSLSDVSDTTTNYIMTTGNDYEEYLLKPMTINHETYSISGNTIDSIDRYEIISIDEPSIINGGASGFVESDLWLNVTSGTTKQPKSGYTYVVVNSTWVKQDTPYIENVNETFIYQTEKNYNGNKQVLSTPFMFYFGLRPQNTSLDLLNKYYGHKGAFETTD